MSPQNYQIHTLNKLGFFWIPWEFETWEFSYHFDASATTSHGVCYMKGGGGFCPSLGYGVSS
jgi:hypothetical protein